DRYVLPQAAQLVTGRIEFHRTGSAHVISEREGQADVYVASANTGVALHGDRVVVRLDVGSKPAPGAMAGQDEGRVIRIVERATTRIVGTLQRSQRFHYVVPDDP